MGKWTKTAGLLFLAAASVYSSQAIVGSVGTPATPALRAAAPVAPAVATVAHVALPVHTAAATPAIAPKAVALDRINAAPDNATDVKVLDESSDPFANAPSTQPSSTASAPAAAGAAATQPSAGRSVSSSEVSVSDAGTVEIHVNDANLVEVLRMLSLQSQKNIVASKEVHGSITANLYDVTVREALDAILHANGYAYREKGNFIYVYTTKEIEDIEKAEKVMKTEVFRVYYMPAADAAIMIKPVLSAAGGQVAVSSPAKAGIASAPTGGGGDASENNDVLVVTDYPDNLAAIHKLLADLDRRPQQILLEATILRATLNESNALGVDFNIMGGVDMSGTVTGAQITGSGVAAPVDATATGSSAVPTLVPDGSVVGNGGKVHSVGTGNSFTSPITSGLKVGFVTDSVSMFLAALEQTTDTTILANPKVLALNKQQGEVFVGNEDGYYTTLTTETTTSQSVESLKTGTRLIFRPYIGNDGYIRMEVHPEDSDGSVKANGLPSKSTTEVTSNIMIKDGHTIVIGGLFRESTTIAKSQVPFLGSLPLAGVLFRNQTDTTVREEVIILLTPHVVKDDAAYSKLSEEELKHAEDVRVGLRKGLMPWGRERLAQGWYEAARKEMEKPNPDRGRAEWELDCATNLNPAFADAIELKQQISGHVVAEADGSSIRSFVRRAMITDPALPTTMPAALVPTMQPQTTALAPATQPTNEARNMERDIDNELPPPAVPGTEAASTTDDSAAVPPPAAPVAPPATPAPAAAPAAAEPATKPAIAQPDYLPENMPTDGPDVANAAVPVTQPAASTQPLNPVTIVTPLEETEDSATTPGASAATPAPAQSSPPTSEPTVTVTPLEEEPADSK